MRLGVGEEHIGKQSILDMVQGFLEIKQISLLIMAQNIFVGTICQPQIYSFAATIILFKLHCQNSIAAAIE